MMTKSFWKPATERALKSGAHAALLVIGAEMANAMEFDWMNLLGFMVGGIIISYLTSIAFGAKDGNPSATNLEVAAGNVLELKSPSGAVIAGPANDKVDPGSVVRFVEPGKADAT